MTEQATTEKQAKDARDESVMLSFANQAFAVLWQQRCEEAREIAESRKTNQ
jgi:hypothetical protein